MFITPLAANDLSDPRHLGFFPALVTIVFVGLVVWGVWDTVRHRRLSITTLGLVAGTSMWWSEWFGDWGAYLLYNPHYDLIPWGSSTWTTPNKPWWMVPAYGAYYAVGIPGSLKLVGWVRRVRPEWGRLPTLLVVTGLFFYAFDVAIEIPATTFGWWTYAHTWGPVYESSRGTFPLLYPVLVVDAYILVVCWLIDRRTDSGVVRFEVMLGTNRVRAGWRRETARLGAWVATLNVAYLVVLMAPLVLIRLAFGPGNGLVP